MPITLVPSSLSCPASLIISISLRMLFVMKIRVFGTSDLSPACPKTLIRALLKASIGIGSEPKRLKRSYNEINLSHAQTTTSTLNLIYNLSQNLPYSRNRRHHGLLFRTLMEIQPHSSTASKLDNSNSEATLPEGHSSYKLFDELSHIS